MIDITNILELPVDFLQFGVLSYRENQNMYITGDPRKFMTTFLSNRIEADLNQGLKNTIRFYQKFAT